MSAQRDGLLKRCDCSPGQWRKCDHAWHLWLRYDGDRYRISLDVYCKRRNLTPPRQRGEAEALVERITGEVRAGTYTERPGQVYSHEPEIVGVDTSLTFDQAWPKFVEAVVEPRGDGEQGEIDPATVKQVKARCRRYAAIVGPQPLASLTQPALETLYRQATKGMANSTKHKYRQALVNLLHWAVANGHLASNPLAVAENKKKLVAGPTAIRTRRVWPDEEANLLEAAREAIADAATRLVAFLVLAFDTAARKGELLALRWADVLWDEGPMGRLRFAAIERGARKNGIGTARRVPMTARVRALLQTLRLDPTGKPWPSSAYVLGDVAGGRVRDIRKAWVTCVLRSRNHKPQWVKRVHGRAGGVNRLAPASEAVFAQADLHIHDIRHERAHRWLEEGKTLATIAQLMGDNIETLRHYLGVAERDAVAEAERLNQEYPVDGVAILVRDHAGRPQSVQPATNRPQNQLRVVRRKETKTG